MRRDIDRRLPQLTDKRLADAALQEARSIYDHRSARLARVESRATTLQATVGIAATLVVAAAAVLLDRNKVTDDTARYALATLAFLLVLALVMTGVFAARATLKTRPRKSIDMLERFAKLPPVENQETLLTSHLRDQVVDLLLAADLDGEIDLKRTRELKRARTCYYVSLALLVMFAAGLLYFAFVMEPPRTAV